MKGIFVTGTDTNVGKTIVSAAILHRYRNHGRLTYWKPVQTGFPIDDDTAVVRTLGRCSEAEIWSVGVRLAAPLSPHLAAGHAGRNIRSEEVLASLPDDTDDHAWIVEGAGGVLVPINREMFMIDLVSILRLPVVVVARTQLGTINHTLLTIEALRSRSIPIAGVILAGEPNQENADSVTRYGAVEILGQLPTFTGLNADVLATWSRTCLDPEARLAQFMSEVPRVLENVTAASRVSGNPLAWQRQGLAHLWHPYTQMKTAPPAVPITHARGVHLYTADGRQILDGISSWWVNIHGHSHPYLNAALARQADDLEHVMFAGFTHRPAALLASRLVEVLPPGLNRIFYSDNGSTAVEAALKMALQFWWNQGLVQRNRFITLDHAYHGDTVGAMSASAESPFTTPFTPFLFSVARAHAPYCFQCPLGLERSDCRIDCLDSLETLLKKHGDTIAGVLVEPMLQGAGGMILWPAEFLRRVRHLCDQYGTLMIADEVLTGFGRTGKMFACEHADISPDLICLSKALTGGYMPLGVTAATEQIYSGFLSDDRRNTFFHGHSFTANPLACAVAIASLDLFTSERSIERVESLATRFRAEVPRFQKLARVGEARTLGGVFVVELFNEEGTRSAEGYLESVGPRLAQEFLRRGLLLRPLGNVLYFMPPYCIADSDLDWTLDQIEDVLLDWKL